jgi:hypothetical protein
MDAKLGTLKRLKLSAVWSHEEHDFTPWLAIEENLASLSEALGLELELERTEVPVGPYWADMLCRDPSRGYVVIENQFGKTNHDHLGKLITYGATLDASVVVWVAETFTEEHRKAIEWLNDHIVSDIEIYAVEPEVLTIDNSLPAIRFNIVSQPNEVVRSATAAKESDSLTATQRLQLDFWTMFRERLMDAKVVTSASTPRPQYWFNVALGRANIMLSNVVNTNEGRIGVRVYLRNRISDQALEQLSGQRAAIESEIGAALQWNPFPNKRDKIISLSRDVDISMRDAWPTYCDWLVDQTARFRKAFMPRIRALILDHSVPGTQSEDLPAEP